MCPRQLCISHFHRCQFNWPTFTSLVTCVGWVGGRCYLPPSFQRFVCRAFTMAKADNTACHGRILPVLFFCQPRRAGYMQFYKGYFGTIVSLFRLRDNWQSYLRKHLNGYSASLCCRQLTFQSKGQHKSPPFAGCGKANLLPKRGEDHHRGRILRTSKIYPDLLRDLVNGNCLPYLARFDVSAVTFDPRRWSLFYDTFRAQLIANGFREYRHPEDNVAIFLRSDIHPSGQLILLAQ